jgi:hypothetical protein
MNPEHDERFRRIADDYLERPGGDYGELLRRGQVSSPEGVDPQPWRAEIRAKARADKIRVFTIRSRAREIAEKTALQPWPGSRRTAQRGQPAVSFTSFTQAAGPRTLKASSLQRDRPVTLRACGPPGPAITLRDDDVRPQVPVRSCQRRGAAIDLILDRARNNRSQILFTKPKPGRAGGRPMISWQTAPHRPARTAWPARPHAACLGPHAADDRGRHARALPLQVRRPPR